MIRAERKNVYVCPMCDTYYKTKEAAEMCMSECQSIEKVCQGLVCIGEEPMLSDSEIYIYKGVIDSDVARYLQRELEAYTIFLAPNYTKGDDFAVITFVEDEHEDGDKGLRMVINSLEDLTGMIDDRVEKLMNVSRKVVEQYHMHLGDDAEEGSSDVLEPKMVGGETIGFMACQVCENIVSPKAIYCSLCSQKLRESDEW